MAWPTSAFPTTLDVITDKADNTDDVLAADINGAYDCIEKLEARVGVTGSAITTSLDYLLKNASSSNPGHKHTLINSATDVSATKDEINTVCDGDTAKNNHNHGLTSNTVSSTPTNITAAQCIMYAHYITNAGATVLNLPEAATVADGAYFVCYMTTAYTLTVNPHNNDRIKLNGVNLSNGQEIISPGSVGNFVTLHKDSATGWTLLGRSGYWVGV